MKRLAFAAALLSLPACSNAGEEAERRYHMAERSLMFPDEECRRKSEVAEAYLAAGDERKFRDWDLSAKIACSNAALGVGF